MTKKEKEPPQIFKDPFDGEYIGNIWGWKISLIGLAVMVFLSLVVWYRYSQLTEEEIRQWEIKNQEQSEPSGTILVYPLDETLFL